jgi:hypothetical protein
MADSRDAPGELLIDLDAFSPVPAGQLKFRSRLYPVRSFSDLPIDEALKILRSEEAMRGKTTTEQLELGLRYIAILVPDMDRSILGGLSSRQMLEVMRRAMGIAESPPEAGAAPSASPIASPSSAASTDGAGERSGS